MTAECMLQVMNVLASGVTKACVAEWRDAAMQQVSMHCCWPFSLMNLASLELSLGLCCGAKTATCLRD